MTAEQIETISKSRKNHLVLLMLQLAYHIIFFLNTIYQITYLSNKNEEEDILQSNTTIKIRSFFINYLNCILMILSLHYVKDGKTILNALNEITQIQFFLKVSLNIGGKVPEYRPLKRMKTDLEGRQSSVATMNSER